LARRIGKPSQIQSLVVRTKQLITFTNPSENELHSGNFLKSQ